VLSYHYLKAVAKGVGLIDEAGFKRNLARILAAFPDTTPIMLMRMSERSVANIPNLLDRHRAFNRWLADAAAGRANVSLISIDDCIRGDDEMNGPMHFHRTVYQRLAATILERAPPSDPAESAPAAEAAPPAVADSPETLVAVDPQALARYRDKGAGDVAACFDLANILHKHGHLAQASALYKRAYDLHSKHPGLFPLAQSLLQARLLCQIKDRQPLDDGELAMLRSLSLPFYNYIGGAQLLANGADPLAAMRFMRNCYEEFHTGEEPDTIYLSGMLRLFSAFTPTHRNVARDVKLRNDVIPRNLFFYWDHNPPGEIAGNFNYHRNLNRFDVRVFDKPQAEWWLYETYGVQARTIFQQARHPAEAADILRAHVMHKYGGYWLDADVRLRSVERFEEALPKNVQHVFMTTAGGVVHSDFFGAVPNSPILADSLLSIYRNCYLHRGLYISYKTGPGVLARALNRIYYNALMGAGPIPSVHVLGQQSFDDVIDTFPVTYKVGAGSWHNL
jgi:mannosyltransferase OCH1-like enzyme